MECLAGLGFTFTYDRTLAWRNIKKQNVLYARLINPDVKVEVPHSTHADVTVGYIYKDSQTNKRIAVFWGNDPYNPGETLEDVSQYFPADWVIMSMIVPSNTVCSLKVPFVLDAHHNYIPVLWSLGVRTSQYLHMTFTDFDSVKQIEEGFKPCSEYVCDEDVTPVFHIEAKDKYGLYGFNRASIGISGKLSEKSRNFALEHTVQYKNKMSLLNAVDIST